MKDNRKELVNELDSNLNRSEIENNHFVLHLEDATDLKRKRTIFELVLSNVLDVVYGRNYTTFEDLENYLKSLIRRTTDIFESEDDKKIEKLLGGEFNKDAMYRGSIINAEKKELPLYFILDLIIGILEKNNTGYYYQDAGSIKKIVLKLKELREKASKLKFSNKFKPLEVIDDYTLDVILENEGLFEIEEEKRNDYNYLVATFGKDKTNMPLYSSDKDKINSIEYNKSKENRKRLDRIIKKYFKNGDIPSVHKFNEEIIDENIDTTIKSALFSICMKKSKYIFLNDLADSSEYLLNKIERIENELDHIKEESIESEIEDKDIRIALARLRYRQKSSLWKFFHKKINPSNINFSEMSEDEIDSLYRRR